MQTTNPFPGMNPFMEGSWPTVHNALMTFICEALSESLPPELNAHVEEEVEVSDGDESTTYRPDVVVREEWDAALPGVWQPEGAAAIAVAEPEIITIEKAPRRWLEIRDLDRRLITAIEVMSPANKHKPGRDAYLRKQEELLHAGVNLVEIDLLRGGQRAWPREVTQSLKKTNGVTHLIIVSRANRPSMREIYYCPLREPLPAIRVPLRVTDLDVPLALQPLIDRVYRTGRYWQFARQPIPDPPLPANDAEWAAEQLSAAGLR